MADVLIDRLFLGAGAMKAGTTWTYAMLDTHPEIFFTPEKEIHYFYAAYVRPGVLSEGRRLDTVRRHLRIDPERSRAAAVRERLRWAANYLDGPVDDHWYRALFAGRRDARWAADFSNLYALLPAEAWARIADRTGALRVLYTMREPVARLWSHLKFHLAITGQADAIGSWSHDRLEAFVRQDFIWENAEYGAALRRMRAGLPDGALLTAFHEDLHRDPRTGLARIERFLGIAEHAYPDALLTRAVNAGDPAPIPDWFRERMARDTARIADEIRAEGLALPAAWSEPARPACPAEP